MNVMNVAIVTVNVVIVVIIYATNGIEITVHSCNYGSIDVSCEWNIRPFPVVISI